MAFKGVFEILWHLESFRNIDLASQGLYRLQIAVQNDEGTIATPKHLVKSRSTVKSQYITKHNLIPSNMTKNYVQTKGFLIKFQEEEIELNEVAMFSIELDFAMAYPNLQLVVQLLHCDCSSFRDEIFQGDIEEKVTFKKVNEMVYSIPNVLEPIFEYLPVTFENQYFCTVNSSVHITLKSLPFKWDDEESSQDIFTKFVKNDSELCYSLYQHYIGLLSHCYDEVVKQYTLLSVSWLPQNLRLDSRLRRAKQPKFIVVRDDINSLISRIFSDLATLSQYITEIWEQMKQLIIEAPNGVIRSLREEHIKVQKTVFGQNMFRDIVQSVHFQTQHDKQMKKRHKQVVKDLASPQNPKVRKIKIEQITKTQLSQYAIDPVIFEEMNIRCTTHDQDEENVLGVHLYVLAHGFDSSWNDMKLLRNHLLMTFSRWQVLCSSVNSNNTRCSIEDLGSNLAKEVIAYVDKFWPGSILGRISFIGHSLGGLIIRYALPLLSMFKRKMHLFCTLSTPHLGLENHESGLVKAGVWFLRQWSRATSISQITLSDNKKKEDKFLYKLSTMAGLGWFRHVVLLSSSQDKYVPFSSARMEAANKNNKIVQEMADNIMQKITASEIYKLNVIFKFEGFSFDRVIGRSAHVATIENQKLMKMLLHGYSHLFK